MPNHCGNRLTVTGDFKARDAFVQAVKGDTEREDEEPKQLDFNKILPQPEDVDRWVPPGPPSPMQLFIGGGCISWRNHYWGTKWGAYDTILVHNEEKTVYTFLTAWAPPNGNFMRAMVAKFPDVKLDLRFAERGVEFYGYWTPEKTETWKFQNDDIETIDENEGEYKLRDGLKLYSDLYEMSG